MTMHNEIVILIRDGNWHRRAEEVQNQIELFFNLNYNLFTLVNSTYMTK
jgi:hypothetical protein